MKPPRLLLSEWLILAAIVFIIAVGLGQCRHAEARAPTGVDPNSPIAAWFNSLKSPSTDRHIAPGMGCCGIDRDCRAVESRNGGKTGIQALLASPWPEDQNEGAHKYWVDVPEDVILQRTDNPVGKAVACISPIDWKQDEDAQPVWYCFVMPYLY